MAQKYDLTDIGNALSRVMDNPMTKIIRSGSIGVLGVVNPVAGIVGGIGNDLLTHDSNAASFCKRILFIQDGVIFHELRRGDESQQEFYGRILKVMAQLGGGSANVL